MISRFIEYLNTSSSKKIYILPAAIVLIILVVSVVAVNLDKTSNTLAQSMGRKTSISEKELEEQYGMKITFLGVAPMMIGSGEVVDLEIQIVDIAKARKLLDNPANTPKLLLNKPNSMPMVFEKSTLSSMMLEYMYPNMGGAVKPGDTLRVNFGDLQLGPMISK